MNLLCSGFMSTACWMTFVCNVIVLCFSGAWALPQETGNFDYPEYNYDYPVFEEYLDVPAVFTVESLHLQAKEGETVIIPCQRTNGLNVLVIKKEATKTEEELLIFVDQMKLRRDRRYKLYDDQLKIYNLSRSDAGTYVCRVETHPPVEITHFLDIEFEPKIKYFTGGESRIHKGDNVKLECAAEGNPPPTITWSKEVGHMPSRALEEKVSSTPSSDFAGLSITLADVDRHVEGSYVCTAENGIGEPASKVMSLVVEYQPEIITEKDMVRTSDGDTIIELACIIHARPLAKVEWSKDGSKRNFSNYIEEQQNGHRNSIRISHISEEDFGEYVCTATNEFGVTEGKFSLSDEKKSANGASFAAITSALVVFVLAFFLWTLSHS